MSGGAPLTGALAPLARFVDALTLDPDGAIRLDGTAVGRAAGPLDDSAALAAALTPVVYDHGYARGWPAPAPVAESGEGDDLSAALAAANSGRPRDEAGWIATGLDSGGGVVASRNGLLRRFAPGQFVAANGELPVRAGSPLAVHIPAGSHAAQPGFYYCFGAQSRAANDLCPIVRLYWNVRADGAVALVGTLTALLNRYRIPFDFKITVRRGDFARRDNAVLYVAQDHLPAILTVLAAAWPGFAGLLDDSVPLFTRAIAPGLAFAEDPGRGDSFGMARSRLVAGALAACRGEDGFDPDRFARAFDAAVEAAGLAREALWRNPGSPDIYAFPDFARERAAA